MRSFEPDEVRDNVMAIYKEMERDFPLPIFTTPGETSGPHPGTSSRAECQPSRPEPELEGPQIWKTGETGETGETSRTLHLAKILFPAA